MTHNVFFRFGHHSLQTKRVKWQKKNAPLMSISLLASLGNHWMKLDNLRVSLNTCIQGNPFQIHSIYFSFLQMFLQIWACKRASSQTSFKRSTCHHQYEKCQGVFWTLLLSGLLLKRFILHPDCKQEWNCKKKPYAKNILFEWQTKKGLAWDSRFCYGYAIHLHVSKWMKISKDDVSITFKLHNYVRVNLLMSMWFFLQYPHFLKSICLASYSEHGINSF